MACGGVILGSTLLFAPFVTVSIAQTATKYIAELRTTDPARAGRAMSLILVCGLVTMVVPFPGLTSSGDRRILHLGIGVYQLEQVTCPRVHSITMSDISDSG